LAQLLFATTWKKPEVIDMSAWRAWLGIFAVVVLTFAGCGSTEESTTDAEGEKTSDTSVTAVAKAGDGSEFYQYIPKKKKTDEAPNVSPPIKSREQKYTFPQDSKTPEVIADVEIWSDNSIKFNGAFEEFRSDGKTKHAVGSFKNDHRDGKWTYYHPNGTVAKEVIYIDGHLDGSWTHFAEDGTKQLDAIYKNGKRQGTWTHYGPKDKDGKQPVTQTMQFTDGLVDGEIVQYYTNGQKRSERRFQKGIPHGVQTQWYEDGKKYFEATFEKGKQNGSETIWDAKGNVVKRREFRDGAPLVTADQDAKKSDDAKKADSAG
jgi:antitoxin component YwqK of YwqJK toxin-antitoxin module